MVSGLMKRLYVYDYNLGKFVLFLSYLFLLLVWKLSLGLILMIYVINL